MFRFIFNFIGISLVVLTNTLANTLPINGQTTGEISNKINVLFTPAGYVFSIWGLIYVLLFLWVFRQFPKSRRNLPVYQNTSSLFLLSCLLNITWIFLWHYEYFFFTVLVMLGLLFTLIGLYTKLKQIDYSFVDLLPFSVYLGWISVATIANISYYLVWIEWDGFGISYSAWTVIMIIVATVLAVIFLIKEKDLVYVLVFIWALIGIGVRNQNGSFTISVFAYSFAGFLLLIISVWSIRKLNKSP